ncbi:hypothetical protein Y032_0717g1788, partial [Ancylostoma ceylanicum]
NIDSVIYFDDVQDSITAEFEKATERSESCFNVFFVTPSVCGLNNEPQYYLVNAEDTLLGAIRGKLVVDRPRFLIVLKSQSMEFLRKKANPIPKQIQSTLPVGAPFPAPLNFTAQPFNQPPPLLPTPPVLLPQIHQPLQMPFMQPSPAGMLMPGHPSFPQCPPNIMPAQPLLNNPHPMQAIPAMGFPSLQQFPGPIAHPIVPPQQAVPLQPAQISRANLVVLTSNPVKTISTKVISEAKPVVLPSNPVQTISTKVVKEANPVLPTTAAVTTTSTAVVGKANPVVSTSTPLKTTSSTVAKSTASTNNPVKTASTTSINNPVKTVSTTSTNNPVKTLSTKVVSEVSYPAVRTIPVRQILYFSECSQILQTEKVDAPTKAPATTVVKEVLMRPVTAQKGTGTKFTAVEMARRDSDKLKKYPWNVQKDLIFKLPLNRAINLFYYLRKTGNKTLNNVRSLLPHRFMHVGIDRIPPSWSLTQPLPMLPGYAPLVGITPITEFEIDAEADDENFELVARSYGITSTKTPENKKESTSSAAKAVPASSSSSTQSMATQSESAKKDKLKFTPPEMAEKDYAMLRKIPALLVREKVAPMQLERLVNLGYHLKKYPLPDEEKDCCSRLKCLIFQKLHHLGVARLGGNWTLNDKIPALPGCTKTFGKVPSTFQVKKPLNNDQSDDFVWARLPHRLKEGQCNKLEDEEEEEEKPTDTKRLDVPGPLTEGDQPKFVRDVEMLLTKARNKGVQMFISAEAKGNQTQECKCFYDPTTDSISWSLMITLEAVRNGKYQEEVFDIHGIYEKDSLQSIVRNFVFDIANRRHSLADEFKPTIRDDNMANVELSIMVPVITENKMVQLKRTAADPTLSLADAIKSKVVVDCPRFIARCKLGFKTVSAEVAAVKEVVEVDPPLLVRAEGSTAKPPSSFKEAAKKTSEEDSSLKGKMEVAFTLTPNQVASNDRDTLKTLPWEDQKLLVSLMPWDRVVALVLLLRACKEENDAKNLLILCNLRLEKLGIGPLPDEWKTSEKVPVLPGHCSSIFPPFSFFDMCEVPLVSRSLNDVRYLSEEVSSLRNDVDSPRLCLRFEPRNHFEQRLFTEARSRGIHFVFSMNVESEEKDRSHYDFASRAILWSVDVTFFKDNNGTVLKETMVMNGISEKISLNEMLRQSVLQFSKDEKALPCFGSTILDAATRFVDLLHVVPRIPSSKFDLERYQPTKLSSCLADNLKEKFVVDRPHFLVVLKDQLKLFSSKLITPAEEKALLEFEESQQSLTKPEITGPQYLNLFDLVHRNLSMEMNRLRTQKPSSVSKTRDSSLSAMHSEPHLHSPIPYEVTLPGNQYGPRRVLPQREMTFSELKSAEDMVAMGCHRCLEVVTKSLHSMRAVSFLSHVAQYWGFKLKEEISVDTSGTRMVVFFEGLPRLVTMGQCQNSSLISATVGAHSCVMAALCYMLVVPFEMWKAVMNATSDDWIDTVIYACRQRFAHLLTLIYSGEFLKLVEFSGDLESEMTNDLFSLWQRFIHRMRCTGIEYWKKNRSIQVPKGVAAPVLSSYPGTYFSFSTCDGVIEWTSMKPKTGWNVDTESLASAEPTAMDRYSEQEFEIGLLPVRHKNPDAPKCPTTGADNWYETVTALPEDPLVQITARDCETRGDKVGASWQNSINSLLLDQISRRLKCKLVRTHLIQWESNTKFVNWFHLVNVKFESIAPFFLQGLGKHVDIRRAMEIAESYLVSSFCRMGIIPLEMYNLIQQFGKEWIDPVLYACRERFATFQKLTRNPVFFSLNTLAKADLYRTTPQSGPPSLFPLAYEFARCIRDTALRYWSVHQLVCVPRSIPFPTTGFPNQFFIFAPIEGFERWDDFNPPLGEVEYFNKEDLLPVKGKVPQWEKSGAKEKRAPRFPSSNKECKYLHDNPLSDDEAATMRQFLDSIANSVSRMLLEHKEQVNSRFVCQIKFSGESGELLYGKASDANEQVAYRAALSALYQKLLKSSFVLPSLYKFIARRFQMNVAGEEYTLARLPYVENVIRPLLQRFEMLVRRYRALITGCEKYAKRRHNEQLLSIVRRLNEDAWQTHPIPLPLHLFVDYEDGDFCLNNLQGFVQILEPSTIWIGEVKQLPKSAKSTNARCEYALTMGDLRNEKVTVTFDDEGDSTALTDKPAVKVVEAKEAKPVGGASMKNGNGTAAKPKETQATVPAAPISTAKVLPPEKVINEDQQPLFCLPWDRRKSGEGDAEGDEMEEEEGDEYLD